MLGTNEAGKKKERIVSYVGLIKGDLKLSKINLKYNEVGLGRWFSWQRLA